MTPNLLYLTETEAYVRPHSDKLQDHYYRSSLDDRVCDSSFHNVTNGLVRVASEPSEVTSPSEVICFRKEKQASDRGRYLYSIVH